MLKRLSPIVLFLIVLVALYRDAVTITVPDDPGLYAGIASAELAMPPGHKMLAFPIREGGRIVDDRISSGAHDPIMIRCLVLKEGPVALALVSCDIAMISESFAVQVRQLVEPFVAIPSDHILIGATHTHHGPVVESGMASEPSDVWRAQVLHTVSQVIQDADRSIQPARIGAGRGTVDLNYNRRFLRLNGRNQQIQRNLERKYYGPADKEIGVLRIDRRDGVPLAVLFDYAMHPMVMGPGNRMFSADFPGAACRTVEQAIGKGVTALYFNGAEGNLNPYPTEINQWDVMEQVGAELGNAVAAIAKAIVTSADANLAVTTGRLEYSDRLQPDRTLYAPVAGIFLQDAAMVSVPGELFVQIGLEFKRRSPFSTNIILGLTGGSVGYIPHQEAYAFGGYGVDLDRRGFNRGQVPVGFGERIWQRWLAMAYERLDALR